MDPLLSPAAQSLNPAFIPCLALLSLSQLLHGQFSPWLLPPDWEPVTPLCGEMGRSKVGQIPEQAGRHRFQLGPWGASLSDASQNARMCLRLIRRCQDSQGRTSECSSARAAVVELNFLISSVALRCQESGPLQSSGFPHCTASFHLIKLPSITELRGSRYHRSNHVYSAFEFLFRCSIAHENYPLCPTAGKNCIILPCTRRPINQPNHNLTLASPGFLL